MGFHIGFVSTRYAGTDGVTLEAAKWVDALTAEGHNCFHYAGRTDREDHEIHCIPEAFFGHPEADWINRQVWGGDARSRMVTGRIREMAEYIKSTLYDFVARFEIDILVAQNCLAIPMHIPLGLALTEFINETGIQTIAHHHDFYWERSRFDVNAVHDILEMAFPPRSPHLQHVVINQAAKEDLAWRKGVTSILVPNVMDFDHPPPPPDDYSRDVRKAIGLADDDIFVLQPTRMIPRKGIEHAVALVQMLDTPKCKLVISHAAGDEGLDYQHLITNLAHEAGIQVRFISDRVGEFRSYDNQGRKIYTLDDIYPHADLVTYPSIYEGFGNALLEAVHHRKPVVVNRYQVYIRDIEPKGFRFPTMHGNVTRNVVSEARRLLEDEAYRRDMTEHNYQVALRHYSYRNLRRNLNVLIANAADSAKGYDHA